VDFAYVNKILAKEMGLPISLEHHYKFLVLLPLKTDAAHKNRLRRVTPSDLISKGKERDYDTEKYREMLLEAAETVLGYIGFDRTVYGDSIRKKNRKWWYELEDERRKDIETERNLYDG
jgi:hypothetical protein